MMGTESGLILPTGKETVISRMPLSDRIKDGIKRFKQRHPCAFTASGKVALGSPKKKVSK